MEVIYLIVVAIVLYFVSDWILNRIEVAAGRRFEYRTIVFFAILLVLALVSFAVIRELGGG